MGQKPTRGDGGVETGSNRGVQSGTATPDLAGLGGSSAVVELVTVATAFATVGFAAVLSALSVRIVVSSGSFVSGFYSLGLLAMTVLLGVSIAGGAGIRFAEKLEDAPVWLAPVLATVSGLVGTGAVVVVAALSTGLLLTSPNFVLVSTVILLGSLGSGMAGAFTGGVRVGVDRFL